VHEYYFTEQGEQLAEDSGVNLLIKQLTKEQYEDPLLRDLDSARLFDYEREEKIQERVQAIVQGACSLEEKRAMYAALAIDVYKDMWVSEPEGTDSEGRLFAVQSQVPFVPAVEIDAYTLGGVVGMRYASRHAVRSLLAKDGYERYGFASRNEAAAFVGARVVNYMLEDRYSQGADNFPGFSIEDDTMRRTISIGGTIHGDFRLQERTELLCPVISPIGTRPEFRPIKVHAVSAYHSVEQSIVAGLLESAYRHGGSLETRFVIGVMQRTVDAFVRRQGVTTSPFAVPYADYGTDSFGTDLIRLQILISEGRDKLGTTMMSQPYWPQSSELFEMVDGEEGVIFQNRAHHNPVPGLGIELPREEYGRFLGSLLEQTTGGNSGSPFGRTSPHQLLGIISEAQDYLDHPEKADIVSLSNY